MAELNRRRIAAVLAADTDVQLRIHCLAKLNGHFHQLAYAVLIQLRKGIVFKDFRIMTGRSSRKL